jgi:hypothetical protein
MLPPSMNMRRSRSSARTSYTDISPDVNPMPTTSIAGDWVKAVIADVGMSALSAAAFGEETKRSAENL